jgi:hypothetical protein
LVWEEAQEQLTALQLLSALSDHLSQQAERARALCMTAWVAYIERELLTALRERAEESRRELELSVHRERALSEEPRRRQER